jgi:hypothetical protein
MKPEKIAVIFYWWTCIFLIRTVFAQCPASTVVTFSPTGNGPFKFQIQNPNDLVVIVKVSGTSWFANVTAQSSTRLSQISASFSQSSTTVIFTVSEWGAPVPIANSPNAPANGRTSESSRLCQQLLSLLLLAFLSSFQCLRPSVGLLLLAIFSYWWLPTEPQTTCADVLIFVTVPQGTLLPPGTCAAGPNPGTLQTPTFVRNLPGETSWFGSPTVIDLDNDGQNEIVATYYSVFIFSANGTLITQASSSDRIYAPAVIADLDNDGIIEIVVGRSGGSVTAYNYINQQLVIKSGWPYAISAEVRGLAGSDLDGDGQIEVVAATTVTNPYDQVFAFTPSGTLYQPAGGHVPAWPRFNSLTGPGNDADVNCAGETGYGMYGLNLGIGNIDEDPFLEILATFDNHRLTAFKYDGIAINSSVWFTNRESSCYGYRMTWAQLFRFPNFTIEEMQYNLHTGPWWDATTTEWLQFTDQAVTVADIDGDGQNEVISAPSVEIADPNTGGYQKLAYCVVVYLGGYNNLSVSAMMHPNWHIAPQSLSPLIVVNGSYPPVAPTQPTVVNIIGDSNPEIIVSLNDGHIYCFDSTSRLLWRYDYTHGLSIMFATEVVVADLNQDGVPELIFGTYGDPNVQTSGYLVGLDVNGNMVFDISLPNPGYDGNGNGAPAAPTIADINGDGQLEILIQTFDHGMDIFTVPGSGTNCMLYPQARGGLLRTGQP